MPQKISPFQFFFTVLFISLLSSVSCSGEKEASVKPIQFIPISSSYILQTPDLKAFLTRLDSLELFQENEFFLPGSLKEQLTQLSSLTSPGISYISISKNKQDSLQYLYISREQARELQIDSVKNKSVETLSYENFEIKKYELEDFITYTAYIDAIFLASNSREHLLAVIDEQKVQPGEDFSKILAAADSQKTSLFINHKHFDKFYLKAFPESLLPISSLAEWSVLDLDFKEHTLIINGISISNFQTQTLLNLFTSAGTQPNELAKLTPSSAAGFYSFTYSNFDVFYENLNRQYPRENSLAQNNLLQYTGEVGVIFGKNSNYVAFKAHDPFLAMETLTGSQTQVNEYRGVSIFTNNEISETLEIIAPLIPSEKNKFYAWLDDFLVFSDKPENLELIISSYLNKTNLWDQAYYGEAMTHLAASSSFLMVANTGQLNEKLMNVASTEYAQEIQNLNLQKYPLIAFQFVQEKNFAHIHGVFSANGATTQAITQVESFTPNIVMATPAFPVNNPINNTPDVVVQDLENNLHLFSSNGKLQWKKELDTRITGQIHQIDLFKNGNLHLAFSTASTLHVLDRTGKAVAPFPLELEDEITQPLSIFDYDSNHNYRFVITQKDKVLMFNSKGKLVTGFKFNKTSSPVIQAPKHLRINNKDYILIAEENGKLHILSRQGEPRIKVKGNIDFSNNSWYAYKKKFVSVSAEGNLVYVDETGKIEVIKETGIHTLQAIDNLQVFLSENVLTVNSKQITLDYGLYSKPGIFKSNSTTYVTITDTQAHRVYVFNEAGNLLSGFPVYGSSVGLITYINNAALLTVTGEEGEILFYPL